MAGTFLIVLLAGQAAIDPDFPDGPSADSVSAQEAGFDDPQRFENGLPDSYRSLFLDWRRPDGPPLVAIQAGHWLKDQVPPELENLRDNGTSAAGYQEADVNLRIAQEIRRQLAPEGVTVEILPTAIPPGYYADLFVAIHADGNPDRRVSGYKTASAWWDITSESPRFAQLLSEEYGQATGLSVDSNVTVNMRGYYAFNWRRYRHSLHPMTVSAILETGFLSNRGDREIIVEQPEKAAAGVTQAILKMLDRLGLFLEDGSA